MHETFKARGEQGSASVEFALISVLFLAFVFGIIELGVYMFDQHVLTNASREGARLGIIMQVPRVSDGEITAKVLDYAQGHMVNFSASGSLNVSVTPNEGSRGVTGPQVPFGTPLVVTVTYPFDFLFLSGFGFGPITMTAETRMRME